MKVERTEQQQGTARRNKQCLTHFNVQRSLVSTFSILGSSAEKSSERGVNQHQRDAKEAPKVRKTTTIRPPSMTSSIPDIPGEQANPETAHFLSARVAEVCGLSSSRFPGSQPVSFELKSLELLEKKDFWVCEKSDGVRVLVYIVVNNITGMQETWLVDRKQKFSKVEGLMFPHHMDPRMPLSETIIDGELVYDEEPNGNVS